ncbi:unnamed protein product, partial [Polarella glacialis]
VIGVLKATTTVERCKRQTLEEDEEEEEEEDLPKWKVDGFPMRDVSRKSTLQIQ